MQARVPFGRCPLCESAELTDAPKGEVSVHPLYHASLGRRQNFGRTRLYALLSEKGFEPLRYGISDALPGGNGGHGEASAGVALQL